jgi:hypothetical protein
MRTKLQFAGDSQNVLITLRNETWQPTYGEQYTRPYKQRILYKSVELSSSIHGLARVFYENSEPNANTSNINEFR